MGTESNITRKVKGGMFLKTAQLAKSALTRAIPRAAASASKGFASQVPKQKSFQPLLSKDEFVKKIESSASQEKPMSQAEFSKLVSRVRPISYPGLFKEYVKNKTAPNVYEEKALRETLEEVFQERGLVEKVEPKSNAPVANEKLDINENGIQENNTNYTTIGKESGTKGAHPKSESSSILSSALKYAPEVSPSKKLTESIKENRAEVIMENSSAPIKMLMKYQPVSDFMFLLAERPGLRKIFKKTYVSSRMTISKRNLPYLKVGESEPLQKDIKEINQIIVRELHKKLNLNPGFQVKSFMNTFDTETLVELKIAISSHYMVHGEKSTRILLKTFVDCAEQGLITKEVLRKFLNDFLFNADDGLVYLKEILRDSAKKSLNLKRTRKEQFSKAIGWFGGRMLWTVIGFSGVATLLLFLGWAGVKSGVPIVDNVFFKLFFRQDGAPFGAVDKVADLIKKKLEEGVEESEVMGKLVFDLLQTTYGDNLDNVKGPMKDVAEKLKKKYMETTKPYRRQTFLEWLTSS
jgi:hypothetical protein